MIPPTSNRLTWRNGIAPFAAVIAALACSSTRPCRDGTALLTITLGDLAASTSALVIEVTLDGGAPSSKTVPAPAGRPFRRSESLEIGIAQYATHTTIAATVIAQDAGQDEIGRGATATTPLKPGCLSLAVSLAGGGIDAGIGGAAGVAGAGGGSRAVSGPGGAGGSPAAGGAGGTPTGGAGASTGGGGMTPAGTGGAGGSSAGVDAGTGSDAPVTECTVGGAPRSCALDGYLGNCANGTESCVDGKWGPCSIAKAGADSCAIKGDDANCDGLPNQNCPCVTNDTQPCGPMLEVGICKRGVQTCQNGGWGACQNAVTKTTRDCTSALDNDCDGQPDNTIDTVCQCNAGTRACDAHPGADGYGPCVAGTQACVVAADKASSAWSSTCTGAVGPAAADLCVYGNDDMCTGVAVGDPLNTQCVCGGFTMPNPASTGLPNPASYQANGDGTVTDKVTGLIWDRTPSTMKYSRADGTTYCRNKGGSWRLPTRIELVSLVDYTILPSDPMINATAFPGTPADDFWTSSTYVPTAASGWLVNFSTGHSVSNGVPYPAWVRCVH